MRGSVKSNHIRSRLRTKPTREKCSSSIKIIKLTSAILVPIMIGAFTVVTTVQESKKAQLQREADAARVERQAQLQQDAENRQKEVDFLKIKEQQEHDDMNAEEIRIQNIYDTFMREISSIVLKDNANITMREILYARAKTALTLEQIDAKRKWYLIKFLYDSQLLYTKNSGKKYIDLAGVDLINVKFGGEMKFVKRFDLFGIRLSNVRLANSSFNNVGLNEATFEFSDLNNSNFIDVLMIGANFRNAILENSKFILIHLQNSTFKNSKLKSSFWSSVLETDLLVFNNIDYSLCDLSESTFQGMTITTNTKFDRTNFQQVKFLDMKFSTGTLFHNLNMRISTFFRVRLLEGKFFQCNMIMARFEKCHFVNVIFDNVDLQQTQFYDILDSGRLHFINVNLNGSNLNILSKEIHQISDSILPNGTFKTSFALGKNLIENSDAEQGICYYPNQSSITISPRSWLRQGNVVQMYYTNHSEQMVISNYTNKWNSCFFFGGYRYSVNQSNLEYFIKQKINVKQLSVIINMRRARFFASAYLGGFQDEQSSTSMRIGFQNTGNKTDYSIVGPVTNVDRNNKTAMLFRKFNGTIPNDTISISIELKFYQQKSHHGLRFGMADNLTFLITEK